MIGWVLLAVLAQPAELELVWAGPPGCPSQADLELKVADLVGRPITVGPGAAWSVQAAVTLRAGGYRSELTMRTADGEELRTLQAPACESLADAVAVIVALALDSDPGWDPKPPAPPDPQVTSTPTTTPARLRVVRPRPRPPSRPARAPWYRPLTYTAEVSATALGALPDPGLGVSVFTGLRAGPLGAQVGALVRRSGLAQVVAGQTVQAQSVAAGLRLCAEVVRAAPWGAEICAAAELGQLRLEGRGRAQGSAWVPWAQVALEPTGVFDLTNNFRGFLRLQMWLSAARPPGNLDLETGTIQGFVVPRVSVGAAFGLRADFLMTD